MDMPLDKSKKMKLLVCHDGSRNAQAALEKCIAMFRYERPEIILVTVVEEPVDASSHDEELFEEWRAKRGADLKEAAERVAALDLDVDAILAIGDPRRMLLEAIRKKNPDIVVIARRGGGGLGHEMVFGSVSAYLVRHVTECPVLIMH